MKIYIFDSWEWGGGPKILGNYGDGWNGCGNEMVSLVFDDGNDAYRDETDRGHADGDDYSGINYDHDVIIIIIIIIIIKMILVMIMMIMIMMIIIIMMMIIMIIRIIIK